MSESIYQPPKAETTPGTPIDPRRGRAMAAWSLVLLGVSVIGLVVIWLALVSMIEDLTAMMALDMDDPSRELDHLQHRFSVLRGVFFSFHGMTLIGAMLGGIALFKQGNRECWFRNSLLVVSCLHALFFPIGTVIGVVLIVGLVMKWSEFRSAKEKEVAT